MGIFYSKCMFVLANPELSFIFPKSSILPIENQSMWEEVINLDLNVDKFESITFCLQSHYVLAKEHTKISH